MNHPYPNGVLAPTISIVIPAINEAENLAHILPLLPAVHEVILVDGNSRDRTVEVARAVLPSIRVIQQSRRGKGNALACGFSAATGSIIVMFDADGSADSREIPRFVQALLDGADVAKGSRFLPSGGSTDLTALRAAGNWVLTRFANLLFRRNYTDLCYGYNAFWRTVLPQLGLPDASLRPLDGGRMRWGDGFEIETVLACRMAAAQLRVTEVPSTELSRIHGRSNLNALTDGIRVLRTLLSEAVNAPRKTARAGQLSELLVPPTIARAEEAA